MKHESEEYVQLMHQYACTLKPWTDSGEVTKEKLGRSEILQAAVVKYIELIGEQAWELHKRSYNLGPNISFSRIGRMRHRLVHEYEGIDWNYVEEVVWEDIPELISELETEMASREIPTLD